MMFCERLKELRRDAELSMMQVANAIGVSDAAVCKWENGTAEPKACYIVKLASFFSCTTDYLLGVTDEFNNSGAPLATPEAVTPSERKLLYSVRKLDEYKRSLLRETADAWTAIDENKLFPERESAQKNGA